LGYSRCFGGKRGSQQQWRQLPAASAPAPLLTPAGLPVAMEPDPAGQPTARMPLQRNLPRSPFPFAPSPRHGMAHGNRAGPLLAPGSTRPSCSSGPSPQPAIAPLARQPPARHIWPQGQEKSKALRVPFSLPSRANQKVKPSHVKPCQAKSRHVKSPARNRILFRAGLVDFG
jgi:hypothetical protein